MNKNIHYTATHITCELENDIYNYIESQLAKKLVQKAAAGRKQYFYYGNDSDSTAMQVAMTNEEAKHLAESSVLLAERLMVLYNMTAGFKNIEMQATTGKPKEAAWPKVYNTMVAKGSPLYDEPLLGRVYNLPSYYALKKYDRQLMSDMYEAMMMVVYDAAAELKGQWDTNGKMTLQNPLFVHTAVTVFNGLLVATTMRYKVLKNTPAGVMEGMHIESAAV